jgi:hypothetical protein
MELTNQESTRERQPRLQQVLPSFTSFVFECVLLIFLGAARHFGDTPPKSDAEHLYYCLFIHVYTQL